MRTAIRDVAEGMDMGLETGSVPGFSCSLYGGVDFEEDDRDSNPYGFGLRFAPVGPNPRSPGSRGPLKAHCKSSDWMTFLLS